MDTTNALSEDFFLGEDSYVRDRIIILGRRSSGKTVYLSALYSKLWESLSSFRIKAMKGPTHLEFFKVIEDLKNDRWPPATQGISESVLELTYKEGVKLSICITPKDDYFRIELIDADPVIEVSQISWGPYKTTMSLRFTLPTPTSFSSRLKTKVQKT